MFNCHIYDVISVPVCGGPGYKSPSNEDATARIVGGFDVECGKYPWIGILYLDLNFLQEEKSRDLKGKCLPTCLFTHACILCHIGPSTENVLLIS